MLKDRRTYEIMRPEDVGVPEATLVLGKHSGRHAVQRRCEQLGVTLERPELDRVYRAVITLADREKIVNDADLAKIVASVRGGREPETPVYAPALADFASTPAEKGTATASSTRDVCLTRGALTVRPRPADSRSISDEASILLLPGDGIGPEVVAAAERVLRAVAHASVTIRAVVGAIIGGAALKRGLPPLPDETLAAARRADAILLGAVGDPAFDTSPPSRTPRSRAAQDPPRARAVTRTSGRRASGRVSNQRVRSSPSPRRHRSAVRSAS